MLPPSWREGAKRLAGPLEKMAPAMTMPRLLTGLGGITSSLLEIGLSVLIFVSSAKLGMNPIALLLVAGILDDDRSPGT